MRIQETKVYKFDELSDDAKDKARAWYLEGAFDYDWYQYIYEDASRIGLRITEFDVDRNTIVGELETTVNEIAANIRQEHGKSCDTYKLALSVDRRKPNDSDEVVSEFKHALLEEYLVMLRKEAEYIQSNEAVDENIKANEYEFTESGERA